MYINTPFYQTRYTINGNTNLIHTPIGMSAEKSQTLTAKFRDKTIWSLPDRSRHE
jgi:hypothetical protein